MDKTFFLSIKNLPVAGFNFIKALDKIASPIIKNLPFVGIIFINAIANSARFSLNPLKPYIMATCALLILNLLLAKRRREITYFMLGITTMVFLGTLSVFFIPFLGQLFLMNAIPALYVALFSVAFFPPLFKIAPFTHEYSKKDYPPAVWSTQQFLGINLILNYIWAGIFVVTFFLSLITYSDSILTQQLMQNIIPMAILLGIGYPLTKFLPGFIQQHSKTGPVHFDTVKDLFSAMPFGMNKKKAEGIDAVVQFHLSGEENEIGYLTIRNQACTYTTGEHPEPTMIINSPSEVWLGISNGEIPGDKALLNRLYTVEGDASLLLKFEDLFSITEETNALENTAPVAGKKTEDFNYGSIEQGTLKKVLVIDGGGRSEKYSKSTLMAKNFCEGIKEAGGEVEYIHLKKKLIKNCCGCYNCWTKTPGVCRYKDDMPDLLLKTRKADLIVYVSPLFIFSVNSRLKTFLDRSIPNIKPYMIKKDGLTSHPFRYEEDSKKGFIIFCAGGFPEVEGNFDGVSGIFRNLSHHSENGTLVGEFYLPAAELLSQPVYQDRRKRVENTCYQAGKQIMEEGTIDKSLMREIQNPGISQDKFQSQADSYWESLEGKMSYYKGTDPL
ncbi:NAD(P)H-dependent oxidoreductase [bacterium]|nr:NAD(P)H-dependent oxidoreductase [bacterium]